ncbi:MAG: FTR1 family protein [Chitinophagaceae bacterium]|nr:FTR1 family protein [Chitinophagaceae bacterium]
MVKGLRTLIFLIFSVFIILTPSGVIAQKSIANDKEIQTVIHLLSYVSMDYPVAVENGKIIDQLEYEEQVEFAKQAFEFAKEGKFLGSNENSVLEKLSNLRTLIDKKRPAAEISKTAEEAKSAIIDITGIATAPKVWPDIQNGQTLYSIHCKDCHGDKGDGNGILAKDQDPRPTNFLGAELYSKFSPYQGFNTIRLGVRGTSMRGYPELSDKEVWDLAFYIKSLPYQDKAGDKAVLKDNFTSAYPMYNLNKVSTLSDEALVNQLKTNFKDPEAKLVALRLMAPEGDNLNASLIIAKNELDAALEEYSAGNKKTARMKALTAYLEGIEPVEARLRTLDAKFVVGLENQMLNVRQAIEKDKGVDAVREEVQSAVAMISKADDLMKGKKMNYFLTFILAGTIMLREALEAFLVLAVVLALIKSSGVRKAIPWLHGGWITAVLLGAAGWFLSDYIIQFGGKNREIMEGLISLVAVVVLLLAGYWLHSNSTAKKWKGFVEDKVGHFLQKEKMFGLAAFSFMVVFREAFEVILFLQAVKLEAAPGNQSAIGLGVLAAFALIGIIAYFFSKYSKRIPIRQLFVYSSWIIVFLAVILIGKGIHGLQESGWVSVTSISSFFRVDWLGIYPTVQTILAQVCLLAVILGTYYYSNYKLKQG